MPKRVDANQAEIVARLKAVGATVLHLHTVGGGCPDIAVGYRGKNWLIEIKDGSKPASERRLTRHEREFFEMWRGQMSVVESAEEALALIGVR